MRPDFNEYFMAIAKIVSTRSTCSSRPVGAVVVRDMRILTTGYNGSVPGAPHCIDQRTEDGGPFCFRRSQNAPEYDKYNYCRSSHAEANAIAHAAKMGISLNGATLYVTLAPCYVCLKLLVTAGITNIYYEHEYRSTEKDRDRFWNGIHREMGIEVFEQLKVSDETLKTINAALKYPTSRRRM